MRSTLVSMFLVVLFLFSRPADAAIIYTIGFDQSIYNVAPGSSFDVKVVLRESFDTGDPEKLGIGGNDGLFSSGFRLDYSLIAGGGAGATVNSITQNDGPGFFDDTGSNSASFSNGLRTLDSYAQTTNVLTGIEVSPISGVHTIELATVNFTASMISGESTTLALMDLDALLDDTVLVDFTSLDPLINFDSAVIQNWTFAAVPEPGSIGLIAVLSGTVGYRRWRRRQSRNAHENHG